MKKIAFGFMTWMLMLFLVSCNQAPQGTVEIGGLRKQVDSLSTLVNSMHEEFEILKYGLSKRGLSIEQMREEMEADTKVWDIPVGESAVLGNPNAKITIVEFSEFQCPYCSRIAPYLDTLMRKYPNDLRMIYKHFPLSFHQQATGAAAAAMAAQAQGKFWEYRFALAPHFRSLTDSTFLAVAQQVGLDLKRFQKEMAMDEAKQKRIDADLALGQKVGVKGTPNFYVNGKRMDRFSPDAIEAMLADLKK